MKETKKEVARLLFIAMSTANENMVWYVKNGGGIRALMAFDSSLTAAKAAVRMLIEGEDDESSG
jgi:hypothetical protein